MGFLHRIARVLRRKRQDEDPRSLFLFQRKPYVFSKEDLQAAAERGWRKCFDGAEDPMYFVSTEHRALTVVKAGPYIVRITCFSSRFSDNDEYALSQLPRREQQQAWKDHRGFVSLDFFNDLSSKENRLPDKQAYATLAQLALELGDENCCAVYLQTTKRNMMMPNDGTAEEGLRRLINGEMPT